MKKRMTAQNRQKVERYIKKKYDQVIRHINFDIFSYKNLPDNLIIMYRTSFPSKYFYISFDEYSIRLSLKISFLVSFK